MYNLYYLWDSPKRSHVFSEEVVMQWLYRLLFYSNNRFSRRKAFNVGAITAGIITILVGALTDNIAITIEFVLVGAAFILFVRRAVRKHNARAAQVKADETRTDNPQVLGPYLLPDEQEVSWEGRSHPLVIAKWWALLFASPIVCICFCAISGAWLFFPLLWGASSAYAIWPILKWRYEWRAITKNSRVIVVSGVFNRQGPGIPLAKLEYVTPIDTFLGRRLGYRHYKFDTPSQSDPFNWLRYVPIPSGSNLGIRIHALLLGRDPETFVPSTKN